MDFTGKFLLWILIIEHAVIMAALFFIIYPRINEFLAGIKLVISNQEVLGNNEGIIYKRVKSISKSLDKFISEFPK